MPYKNPLTKKIQNKLYNQKNRLQIRESKRKTYLKRKLELFEILGGIKCVKCGFNDIRALQLDHINGGGNKEIRIKPAYRKWYNYYSKHPDEAKKKYQILCANCNWIKRIEEKEYLRNQPIPKLIKVFSHD